MKADKSGRFKVSGQREGLGFSVKGASSSVKGTGFSPYIIFAKLTWALAPEGQNSQD